MDTSTAKAIIAAELRRRVRFSGGPEVFRHLLIGHEDLADAAVRELVREGVLKETPLRVGTLYHYPAATTPTLEYLADQLAKLAEAPTRPARATAATESTQSRTAATDLSPRPARHGAPHPASQGTRAATGPRRGETGGGAGGLGAGPASGQDDLAHPELLRGHTISDPIAGEVGAPPVVSPTSSPDAGGERPAPTFTGPIRARKKSELAAEAAAAAAAATAPSAVSETADAPAAPPVFTGPVKAKKKSQIAAEEAAAATAGPAAGPSADGSTTPAPATGESPVAPPVYTGPIKAKKKSQIAAEERGESSDARPET